MSERSFRRDRERRLAAEKRRDAVRARKAATVAAAAGAFALAAPAVSSAATFTVTQPNDGPIGTTTCVADDTVGPCNLRDAIEGARTTSGPDDVVFASGLTGSQITLLNGPLYVHDSDALSIYGGPNPGSIYIDGNGDSMVFDIGFTDNPSSGPGLTISGVTVQNGVDDPAGGIYVESGHVLLEKSTVTGNTADGAQVDPYSFAAGGGITNRGHLTVDNSTIGGSGLGEGNTSSAQSFPYPVYGGGGIDNLGDLNVTHSTITGNQARTSGGGIFNGFTNYPTSLNVSDTTINGNFAYEGGGVASANFLNKYGDYSIGSYGSNNLQLTNSTVSGNAAVVDGGGIGIKYLGGSTRWKIDHTTVSDNVSYVYNGGGVAVGFPDFTSTAFAFVPNSGSLEVVDSTVSGNYANTYGGGVMLERNAEKYAGTVKVDNSTIASNHAYNGGGGIYQAYTSPSSPYGPYFGAQLFSTIVGDNTLGDGTPSDLEEGTDFAGPGASPFDLSFSLVEAPRDSILNQNPAGSNLIGIDAQLGGLGNNGGPTQTQLPSINSPVVDKGSAPGNLTTDQRGNPRTVDTSPANADDGTDIGAVELPTGPPVPSNGTAGTKVHNVKKKHKKRRQIIRTKHKFAKIHLTFGSSNPAVTNYKCSLDGAPAEPCTSPFSARAKSGPGNGKNHVVVIQAYDANGNPVGKPRTFRFRVVLKG